MVPAATLNQMTHTVYAFWTAADRNDSVAIATLTVGEKAQAWIRDKRSNESWLFFRVTAKKPVVRLGYYYPATSRDTAIVQVEVLWYRCGPPVRPGNPDNYFLKLVRMADTWRIKDVWMDPC
jgi:hypothetical protein